MGIWDYINSTTDKLKGNTPDLTVVKNACRTSYDYSWSAITKIDSAVRVNGIQKLNGYLPDDELGSKIHPLAKNVAKNAAIYAWREGVKCIPGGVPLDYVISRSLRDCSKSGDDRKKEFEALQARMGGLEKEVSRYRKLIERAEIYERDGELESRNALNLLGSDVNQKPEDVISVFNFMMKGFVGRHLFDDKRVPGVRSDRSIIKEP